MVLGVCFLQQDSAEFGMAGHDACIRFLAREMFSAQNHFLGRIHFGCSAFRPSDCSPLRFQIRNPEERNYRYRRTFSGFVGPRISKLWTRTEAGRVVAREAVEAMGGAERNNTDVIELKDAAAFQRIAENGLISICGFGSLLSERSARQTFPELLNFRVAVLHGFRRVFAHVAPVFLERGIANVETKEMSSLSVEPFPSESIVVTVFEISQSEVSTDTYFAGEGLRYVDRGQVFAKLMSQQRTEWWMTSMANIFMWLPCVPAFIEREHEFRFLAVTVHTLEGDISAHKAVICARYSDEEYRRDRCQGDDEYHRRYGRFDIQQIWRDDILPCRVYLRHCVLAAQNLSQEAYDSFLDHTYLGNRTTTIGQHLAADEKIMQEEPPPSLRQRYGG